MTKGTRRPADQPALVEVIRRDAPVPPLAGWVLIAYWAGPFSHWKLVGLYETPDEAELAFQKVYRVSQYRHVTLYRVEHEGR